MNLTINYLLFGFFANLKSEICNPKSNIATCSLTLTTLFGTLKKMQG